MEKREVHMYADLKNRFCYAELDTGEIFHWKDFDKNNHLVFLLSGNIEVIYGGSLPRMITEGNMIFLTPLSNYVCRALMPVKIILLGLGGLEYSCDKYIFQNLTPIFLLLKYEFKELEIRTPLDVFLDLIQCYLRDGVSETFLFSEKIKELFIVLRAYYNLEELTMFFYPLLGKNMEFKKMVTDNFLKIKNGREYAELCGYSLGAFQNKFKDVFGETVYQWMQRQKAEQIKHRLMTTDINLKDLAEELDFTSPAHLNKFCKVWFGMTPSEVRQTFLLKKNLK